MSVGKRFVSEVGVFAHDVLARGRRFRTDHAQGPISVKVCPKLGVLRVYVGVMTPNGYVGRRVYDVVLREGR